MLYLHTKTLIVRNKILFILSLILLISCKEERDMKSNIVVSHMYSQPDGLHPFNNNSVMRSEIFALTQRTLLRLDIESLEYIPSLLKDLPSSSEDNKTFYFELKDNVKWDDGSQLTAEDVIFSSKIMLCHLTDNSQIRPIYTSVIKSVDPDPLNPLKFSMTAKDIKWTAKTIMGGIYIQQKKLWDPNGVLDNISFEQIQNKSFKETKEISNWFNNFNSADNSYKIKNLHGLGPYKVSEWKTEQYITLEKKKKWWGANEESLYSNAFPEKIIFKLIKEPAAVELALKNQDIDVTTNVGTNELLKLRNKKYFTENYESDFKERYGISYIGLNMRPDGITQKPFFVDQRVRRAIAHLIPVEEIIEVIMYGHASRQAANVSPLKKTYNDTLKLIELDIDKANKLLDEAGWIDTDGDNVRDKIINGKKIPFEFDFSYMQNALSTEIVLIMKESMYKAGVVANPNGMDFNLFYKNAANHKFDAMLGGWGSSAAYSNPMQLWHTSSWVNKGSNFCGFGDAESDALIDEANNTLDYETHRNALLKLQARIYEDQPYVFLYTSKRKFAMHKRFKNRKMYFESPGVLLNNLELAN